MPRGSGGVLLIVLALVTAARGLPAQETDPLRVHHERAQSFQLAGELERAEAEYRAEVLPRALRRLGNLSGAEGRVDEGIEHLEEAARLAPADVEIQIDRAVAWLRKGELSRASKLAQDAVAAAPANPRALSLSGRLRLLAGDAGGAIGDLRTALDKEPRFDTAYALALATLHLKRLENARALFDQMKVANSTSALLVLIGRAYLEANYPALAIEEFNRALTRDSQAGDAHYYSGVAHLSNTTPDRVAKARASFEAELRAYPSHSAARSELNALLKGRDAAAPARGRRVLLDLLPTAAASDEERRRVMRTQLQTVLESAWHNLAVIHTRRGETDAAADAQRRAARWSGATESASTGTMDADKALGSAEQLIQAGDAAGAERAIQPLLEQRPDLPAALRVLGLIRAAQGRYDEAEALLRRAIERDPTEHAALLTLAEAYVARGEYQRATATLDRMPAALQTSASSVRLRAYLGAGRSAEARRLVSDVAALATADEAADVVEALLARDMVADAERLLDEVGNRRLSSARLLVASARLRVRAGDARGAESLLQRGLTLQPDSVEALRLLAQVASDRGDDARAADLLVTANEHAPDSPELLRQLAEASARAARLEEALAAARRLATLRPDDIDAKRLLAVTLLQNQNWREAIAILESPPPAAAGDARWTLALGMAEFGRRAYDAARAAFERALALDPDLVEARFHLGLIAREQGRTADAIGALSAVVARDPAHRAAHLEIGTLYLSTGDLGRARSHLECAAGLNPDDPAPHYQLALLARREGDTDRARGEMQLFQKKREKALADAPANVVKSPSRKGGC